MTYVLAAKAGTQNRKVLMGKWGGDSTRRPTTKGDQMKKSILMILAILMCASVAGAYEANYEPYKIEAPDWLLPKCLPGIELIEPPEDFDSAGSYLTIEGSDDFIFFQDSSELTSWDSHYSADLYIDFDDLDKVILCIGGKEYRVQPSVHRFLSWHWLTWKVTEE